MIDAFRPKTLRLDDGTWVPRCEHSVPVGIRDTVRNAIASWRSVCHHPILPMPSSTSSWSDWLSLNIVERWIAPARRPAAVAVLSRVSRREWDSGTCQIRRSPRAVCANLSESWRKRRYPKHFVSKLSDADAESSERRTWLRFARNCEYLDAEAFETLDDHYATLTLPAGS
jgi:four helix bundle protein